MANGVVNVPDMSMAERSEVERKVNRLFAFGNFSPINLSPTFARVLALGMYLAKFKRTDQKLVSTTTLFLAAALISSEALGNGRAYLRGSDDRLDQDGSDLANWRPAFEQDRSILTNWFREYFGTNADLLPKMLEFAAGEEPYADGLGPGLERHFQLAGGEVLRLSHFLIDLGEDPAVGLAKQLQVPGRQGFVDRLRRIVPRGNGTLGDKPAGGTVENERTDKPAVPYGESLAMRRETESSEVGPGFADYALGVATVLRAATGEFTFALLGRWGSGKTTLTTLLKPMLTDPTDTSAEVSKDKKAKAAHPVSRYAVVVHNAWKYRAPPEAWIYLYKSLADAAAKDRGWVDRLALASRKTFERKGPWPATLALLVLALVLAPFAIKIHLLGLTISLIGFSTVIHLSSIGASATRRVRELLTDYLAVTSHETKLGMLATIGDDVKSLLIAWTVPLRADRPDAARGSATARRFLLPWLTIAITAGLWLWGLNAPISQALLTALPSLPEGLQSMLGGTIATAPSVGDVVLAAAWLGLSVILLVLPWIWPSRRPNRVLLVVDDLDRCSAAALGLLPAVCWPWSWSSLPLSSNCS